uniref:Uncharacterized protein n=1 Tax=Pipistrellus kuhlii TaxID=59472 RepID=A0A7J7TLU0_PIPKU|nr:hypothetical protein mPipKuh1_009344 [Pipistrellus kuhlii]
MPKDVCTCPTVEKQSESQEVKSHLSAGCSNYLKIAVPSESTATFAEDGRRAEDFRGSPVTSGPQRLWRGKTEALTMSKEFTLQTLAYPAAPCCWKLLALASPAGRGKVDTVAPVVQILPLSLFPSLCALRDSLSASAEEAVERAVVRRMLLTLNTSETAVKSLSRAGRKTQQQGKNTV